MPANQPIPQPLLEVLALGEPNAPTIADLARRAGVDEVEVRRLVARIEDSNRQILETYPPNVVAAGIRARLDSQPGVPRRRSWFVMPAVACVLATVVLGALWVLHPVQLPRLDEGLRVKGATRLVLYRQTTGQPELLHDGSTARAGDVLQLGYIAAGARHGVLLSVDGVGKVTLHFPSTPTEDTSLRAGTTLLPFSFRLDEAPGFERFILITSDRPLEVSELLRRAETSALTRLPLQLPPSATSQHLLLRKQGQKAR